MVHRRFPSSFIGRPAAMSEAPPLTDRELNAAFREGASDEDIEAVLRDLVIAYQMAVFYGDGGHPLRLAF